MPIQYSYTDQIILTCLWLDISFGQLELSGICQCTIQNNPLWLCHRTTLKQVSNPLESCIVSRRLVEEEPIPHPYPVEFLSNLCRLFRLMILSSIDHWLSSLNKCLPPMYRPCVYYYGKTSDRSRSCMLSALTTGLQFVEQVEGVT